MLSLRVVHLIRNKQVIAPIVRWFHHEFSNLEPQNNAANESDKERQRRSTRNKQPASSVRNKFKVFEDKDSTEVFDVEEERQRYQLQDEPDQSLDDEYLGLNLERGIHGVFEIEDLVEVLRKEHAEDIFVCSVPSEVKYVDYMVVCSGRSYRHMLATAEFVRRMYKIKRRKGDILPKIEGEKSRDWMALDLGNIALHIFAPMARELYDLESLWAIGIEFDKESNKPQNNLEGMFDAHSALLADYKQNDVTNNRNSGNT